MCTHGVSKTSKFGSIAFKNKALQLPTLLYAGPNGAPPIWLNKLEDSPAVQENVKQGVYTMLPCPQRSGPGIGLAGASMPRLGAIPTALPYIPYSVAAIAAHQQTVATTVLGADIALFLAQQNDMREIHRATHELCELSGLSWADALQQVAKKLEPAPTMLSMTTKLLEKMCPT